MSFAHRSRVAALAAALTLVAAGGLALIQATPASATSTIRGVGMQWSPVRTNIVHGGSVRWSSVSNTHQSRRSAATGISRAGCCSGPEHGGEDVRRAGDIPVLLHDPREHRERDVPRDVRQDRRDLTFPADGPESKRLH